MPISVPESSEMVEAKKFKGKGKQIVALEDIMPSLNDSDFDDDEEETFQADDSDTENMRVHALISQMLNHSLP